MRDEEVLVSQEVSSDWLLVAATVSYFTRWNWSWFHEWHADAFRETEKVIEKVEFDNYGYLNVYWNVRPRSWEIAAMNFCFVECGYHEAGFHAGVGVRHFYKGERIDEYAIP